MRLLLTRPQEDSSPLATRLAERGHETLVEPLLTIRPDLTAPLELDGVAGLLFTSANGVRAFALRSERRDLPAYAVGEATAQAARELGFASVETAGGNVESLARLVGERRRPEDGALLHAAGSVTAGDLAGALRDGGFEVRRAVLYAAEPVHALSQACATALREGRLDAAVFYSPRTATAFVTLVQAAGLAESVRSMTLVGMSEAVIEAGKALPWARAVAAASPDEPAMLETIERLAEEAKRQAAGPPPVAVAAPRRRGGGGALAAAIALVALGLAGWTAWRQWESERAPRERGFDPAPLTQRLERHESMLARLGSTPAAAPAIDPARFAEVERTLARLGSGADQLSTRVDAVERAAQAGSGDSATETAALAALAQENRRLAEESARLAAELAAVRREVASLVAASQQARGREGLALAVAPLREAVASGRPYADELAALRAAGGGDGALEPALATLAAHAARGVAPPARLRAEFPATAAAIVRAAAIDNPASPWWHQALARLAALVQVRRVGAVEGDGADALAARAELLLEGGDLAGAIATLAPLAGAPAAAAAPWLAQARARVEADAALALVTRRAIGG